MLDIEPAPRRSRLHPNIFRPPRTPNLDIRPHREYQVSLSGSSLIASEKNENGKRSRPMSSRNRQSSPLPSIEASYSTNSSITRSDAISPEPLVKTRYTLKNGVDMPAHGLDSLCNSVDSMREINFRRRWSTGVWSNEMEKAQTGVEGRESRDSRRRSSTLNFTEAQKPLGWGGTVLSIFGSVAGHVWSLCNTAVFSGFQAGTGEQFQLQSAPAQENTSSELWEDVPVPRRTPRDPWRSCSPMPGTWPDQEVQEDEIEAECYSPSKRPSKRLHTDAGQDWIMVERISHNLEQPGDETPSRRTTTLLSTTNNRASLRTTARRPGQTHSRRTSAIVVSNHGNNPQSPTASRRQSYLSPTTTRRTNSNNPVVSGNQSPVSAEVHRHTERVRREERQNDASLRRLNDRLAAMIREGKEALGTKVEIVDDVMCEDEGYSAGVFG